MRPPAPHLTHIDGTPIFQTPEDTANEQAVAAVLERAWGCELKRFSHLCAVDWWAQRHGRVTGVVEMKCRTHASTKYATAFLPYEKWDALHRAACAFGGCPGIFVWRFTDGIRWVRIKDVDPRDAVIRGKANEPHRFEPVIEVPVAAMAVVATPEAAP